MHEYLYNISNGLLNNIFLGPGPGICSTWLRVGSIWFSGCQSISLGIVFLQISIDVFKVCDSSCCLFLFIGVGESACIYVCMLPETQEVFLSYVLELWTLRFTSKKRSSEAMDGVQFRWSVREVSCVIDLAGSIHLPVSAKYF